MDGMQVFRDVHTERDLRSLFVELRNEAEHSDEAETLDELHRRAHAVVALTRWPSWGRRFGANAPTMRHAAVDEYRRTTRLLNQRARKVRAPARYPQHWEPLETEAPA